MYATQQKISSMEQSFDRFERFLPDDLHTAFPSIYNERLGWGRHSRGLYASALDALRLTRAAGTGNQNLGTTLATDSGQCSGIDGILRHSLTIKDYLVERILHNDCEQPEQQLQIMH